MQYSKPNPGVMRPQQPPLAPQTDKLRAAGRDGDTILAHINPQEAKMLMMAGGRGTPNPVTGLPEFATQANFDSQMYLQQNPDVSAAGMDPWQHYSQYGQTEGRVGNAEEQQIRAGGYTGGFGGGQYVNWANSLTDGRHTEPWPLIEPGSEGPNVGSGGPFEVGYKGPSISDISGVMTPRFNTLDQGQQGILTNQGVIQQGIGDVGTAVAGVNTNVGNIGTAIGTPATQGQTLFGDIQGVGNQVSGVMSNMDNFGNDLSSFRGAFDTNASKTMNTLNDVREQGLSQRSDISRQIQDQQPAIARMDNTLGQPNPFYSAPAAAASGVMAPSATAATNASLNQAAQSVNLPMGPMGPIAVDPRDMV
jgi:hypothetical protein